MDCSTSIHRRLAMTGLAAGLCALSVPGLAATTGTTFNVTATVADSCSITATDLDFSLINPLATGPHDAESAVNVTCTTGTAYTIGLDAGQAVGATESNRMMTHTNGVDTLSYGVFQDAARTVGWGGLLDLVPVVGLGVGTTQIYTVYGRIPAGQETARVGAYADLITVTLSY